MCLLYLRDPLISLFSARSSWHRGQSHYERAVYIDMDVGDGSAVEAETADEATRRGWQFERMTGNLVLIRQLLEGNWGADFLVVQPGEQIAMAYGDEVVCSAQIQLE